MSRTNENTLAPPRPGQRKHPSPPPPYTEFAPGEPSSPLPSSVPFPSSTRPPPPVPQPPPPPVQMPTPASHPGYGPTPLATNQPLLPYVYYAPRESADVRARWRFFRAFMWAVAVWVLLGFVIGVEVWGEDGWDFDWDWDWGRFWGLDGFVRSWVKFTFSNGAVE